MTCATLTLMIVIPIPALMEVNVSMMLMTSVAFVSKDLQERNVNIPLIIANPILVKMEELAQVSKKRGFYETLIFRYCFIGKNIVLLRCSTVFHSVSFCNFLIF